MDVFVGASFCGGIGCFLDVFKYSIAELMSCFLLF